MKPYPVKLPIPGKQNKSPTQRTLEFLRKCNCVCGIVERRNPKIKNKTHDLFGIIDIIAITREGVLGVQSTGSDFSGHWFKLTQTNVVNSARWLSMPNAQLMLIGWRKIKGSDITLHWEPRIQMITMADLQPALREQNIRPQQIMPGSLYTLFNAITME